MSQKLDNATFCSVILFADNLAIKYFLLERERERERERDRRKYELYTVRKPYSK
jgi:hypothetical protein